MRRSRVVVAVVALVALAAASAVRLRRHPDITPAPPAKVRAPEGVRVRVQVLNSTKTRGLARRATMLLRDRGFDVVETGNIAQTFDTTVVLDLSGHPDWAASVAKLFGTRNIQVRHDSSRYLDIAVLLGTTWRPPSEPFYP
jgi:hypothetical protein